MAAYVAGRNQLALLANAFSGAAKGAQDFAQLKMQRDQMAQQQAQFEANLDLGFQRLDEQINSANLDREQRANLQSQMVEARSKWVTQQEEGALERTQVQQAGATSRKAMDIREQRRQFNFREERDAREELAVSKFVGVLEPAVVVPDPSDPTYPAMVQQREQQLAEHTRLILGKLSATGQPTPDLERRARAIAEDVGGFQRRVTDRQSELALARMGKYVSSAPSQFSSTQGLIDAASWDPAMDTAQVYQFVGDVQGGLPPYATRGQLEKLARSGKVPKNMVDELYQQKPIEQFNKNRFDRNIDSVLQGLPDSQQPRARSAWDSMKDARLDYEIKYKSSDRKIAGDSITSMSEKRYIEKAEVMDQMTGADDNRFATAARDHILSLRRQNDFPELLTAVRNENAFVPGRAAVVAGDVSLQNLPGSTRSIAAKSRERLAPAPTNTQPGGGRSNSDAILDLHPPTILMEPPGGGVKPSNVAHYLEDGTPVYKGAGVEAAEKLSEWWGGVHILPQPVGPGEEI